MNLRTFLNSSFFFFFSFFSSQSVEKFSVIIVPTTKWNSLDTLVKAQVSKELVSPVSQNSRPLKTVPRVCFFFFLPFVPSLCPFSLSPPLPLSLSFVLSFLTYPFPFFFFFFFKDLSRQCVRPLGTPVSPFLLQGGW